MKYHDLLEGAVREVYSLSRRERGHGDVLLERTYRVESRSNSLSKETILWTSGK